MEETEPSGKSMAMGEYHAQTDYIGKHGLDLVARSPAHFFERYLSGKPQPEPTHTQAFGTLTHMVVFEPERIGDEYVIAPEGLDRRTKEYKLWRDSVGEKTICTVAEMERAQAVRDAVLANPFLAAWMAEGEAERSVFAHDPETGVRVKARPDWMNHQQRVVLDLKTTNDARHMEFSRISFNFRYHVQAAFYLDVLKWARFGEYDFVFIAAENQPPYGVSVFVMDNDSLQLGRETYRRDLAVYAECLRTGTWPNLSPQPQSLRLPGFAWYV